LLSQLQQQGVQRQAQGAEHRVPAPAPPAERAALLLVKASLDPQNRRLASWSDKSCQCSGTWAGVTCASGAVTSV
jgi:hypothetical protein